MVPIRHARIRSRPARLFHKIFGLAFAAVLLLFLSRHNTEDPPITFEPSPLPPDLERKEAPMLEKLVSEGKLPPLKERLPKNPAVVEPVNEPGRYGGVWRRHTLGLDRAGMSRLIYDPAMRWSADGTEIKPNLCWKYEVSDDHRIFTFFLREGVRWSDGHPMTSEDVRFWWEDFILNPELNPLVPTWMQIQGEAPKIEIPGPYRFRFIFPHPYGLFLERAAWQGEMWLPRHHLEQFHEKYTPRAELNAKVEAAGFGTWYQLFLDKVRWWSNHELPMISAWFIKHDWNRQHKVFERNPYYWKVDTLGRQLPYIDRVTHVTFQNRETLLLNFVAGDILVQMRYVTADDLPLFEAPIRDGTIEVYTWIATGNHAMGVQFNQTYTGDDDFARELLREKKFHRALSHALNREEISRLFHYGRGTPRQPGPIEQSPYFEGGRRYVHTALEYDLAKANRLLDELGLTRWGPHGFRLRPDGEPVALTVDYSPTYEKSLQAEYFNQKCLAPLGIKGIHKPFSGQRGYAGLAMILLGGSGGRMQELISPSFIPTFRHLYWATQYGLWYESNGRQGWRPPDDIARMQEVYDRIKASPDRHERYTLMGEIWDLHAENLWYIGSLGELPQVVLVHRRAGNVPRYAVADWVFKSPGNAHPEQFYCKW